MNDDAKTRALSMIMMRVREEAGPLPQSVLQDLMLTGTVWMRVQMDENGDVRREFLPADKVMVKE